MSLINNNKYPFNGGAGPRVIVVNEGSSLSGTSSSILSFLLILSILAIGAYFAYKYFYQGDVVATDTVLEKNKPYLVATTNTPNSAQRCQSGVTYGFNAAQNMYVDKGCSGVFIYTPDGVNKKLGVCTTNDTKIRFCDTTGMTPDLSPTRVTTTGPATDPLYTLPSLDDVPTYNSLTGFLDMKDENIGILQQNGNCRPGNYGFYGNNMISVSNGCKGVFVFGPLIGKCEASDATTTKLCPIGSLDFSGQGLTLQDVKPVDTSSYCNQGQKYGFTDEKTAFKDPSVCKVGGVLMGDYSIQCDAKGVCPLNPNSITTT